MLGGTTSGSVSCGGRAWSIGNATSSEARNARERRRCQGYQRLDGAQRGGQAGVERPCVVGAGGGARMMQPLNR